MNTPLERKTARGIRDCGPAMASVSRQTEPGINGDAGFTRGTTMAPEKDQDVQQAATNVVFAVGRFLLE
jgi:hypothetical protein